MKQLIISAILFLSGITAYAAVGDTFTQEGLTYVIKSNNTVGIYSVSNDVTECTITPTIIYKDITYNVTSIERDAFYWSNVTKVTLPNTITEIGYGAFRSSPLESINIPSTVKTIGAYAFYKTNIKTIEVPEGITVLENATFSQCYELESIKLPSSLEKISQATFYKSNLAKIEIPAKCTQIDAYAFEASSNLEEVILPNTITELSMGIFKDCTKLSKVNLPEALTSIKTMAFQGCAISSIHFPATVSSIEASAFNDVPLSSITLDENNETFTLIDGALYTKDKRFIYLYPRITESKKYDIIDGCVAVYGGAFYGCDVKTVTFPKNFLGLDAFAFCYSQLETVNLPNTVEIIYDQAFAGTKLSHITIPEGVKQLSEAILADCKNLKTVTLPTRLTDVGNRVFFQCTALETINCLGEVPSEFDAWETYTDPFFGVDCSKITVKCPQSALTAYKISEWGDFFTKIVGTDFSSILTQESEHITISIVNNSINIALIDNLETNISIFTAGGSLIFSKSFIGNNTEITDLPQGVYLISVSNNKTKTVQKIKL